MSNLLIKLRQLKRNYEIHQSFKQALRGKTTGSLNIDEAQDYLQNLIEESN